MSKRKGKNTYSLYDPLDNAFMARLPERFATCIDSDEDPGLANSGMDRYAFGRLHEAGNEEEAVNSILAMIGEQMDVDRV